MTQPLRIAITCLSGYGGSSVIAAELAVLLAERGHHVWLVAARRPGRAIKHERLKFVPVQAPAYPALEQPQSGLAMAGTLVELARTHDLDVIHAHYAIPHAAIAWMARQTLTEPGPALIATLHGSDVTHLSQANVYREVTRAALLNFEARTAPSSFLAQEATHVLGLTHKAPVEVIGNFVDAHRFAPTPGRDHAALDALFNGAHPGTPTLVHISNFRPVKRVLDVIRIAAKVRAQIPVRLLMIGDGPDHDSARHLATTLGLGDAVHFTGARNDAHTLLPRCAVLLLPSESESFGLVALEAMSCSVPVVASHVGGIPEVVEDGLTGHLAPIGDIDAMAKATIALLADPEQHALFGARARTSVLARWAPEHAVDAYLNCYHGALRRHHAKD